MIRAVLMAREAHGKATESLTGAWQRVDGSDEDDFGGFV